MESDVSASAEYRYKQADRMGDLGLFRDFKALYSKYFNQQQINRVKQVYQHGICGRNQHKHTVVVDRIGNIKLHELSKVLQDEDLIHYTSQRLLELSESHLLQKQQIVWIFDLGGKIMQLASKKIVEYVQKIITNAQKYFPEMIHMIVFVNTPMLFDTIWGKFQPLLAKNTLQKVIMIGEQLQNLYEFAEPAILPQFLGGQLDQQAFLLGKTEKVERSQQSFGKEEEEGQEQIDFQSLKMALGGLKLGESSMKSVSQTPLNTETDK